MIQYYDRAVWDDSGAPRLGYVVPESQFVGLAIHHTVTTAAPGAESAFAHMRRLRTERPDLGEDVPYSWVVFRGEYPTDAIVCEGRGPGRTGAHTYGYNSSRYGIAVVGNYENEAVTGGILDAIDYVGRRFCPWASEPTWGHRQFPKNATACPGDHLVEVLADVQPPFPSPTPVPQPTDKGTLMMRVFDENGTGYILDGMKAYPMTEYPMHVHEVLGDVAPYALDSMGGLLRVDRASLAAAYEIQPVK